MNVNTALTQSRQAFGALQVERTMVHLHLTHNLYVFSTHLPQHIRAIQNGVPKWHCCCLALCCSRLGLRIWMSTLPLTQRRQAFGVMHLHTIPI
jgi:hypothetical protein